MWAKCSDWSMKKFTKMELKEPTIVQIFFILPYTLPQFFCYKISTLPFTAVKIEFPKEDTDWLPLFCCPTSCPCISPSRMSSRNKGRNGCALFSTDILTTPMTVSFKVVNLAHPWGARALRKVAQVHIMYLGHLTRRTALEPCLNRLGWRAQKQEKWKRFWKERMRVKGEDWCSRGRDQLDRKREV